jgi:hypothetical protein
MTRKNTEMPNNPPTLAEAQQYATIASQDEWDQAGWSDEALAAQTGPKRLTSIVSLRLEYETVRRFRRAARLRGKSLSEFLRVGGEELAARIEREEGQSAKVISVSFSGQKSMATTIAATPTGSESMLKAT